MTKPGLLPNLMFDNDRQAAFFFGEPLAVAGRIWTWFVTDADIYRHLAVTLTETLLAFGIGSVLGLACGLWLALAPLASAILEPYIKALNSMPRIILAPIFAVWFGLGIGTQGGAGRDAGVLHRLLQRLPGREGSQPGGAGQRAHAGRQQQAAAAPRLPAQRHELGLQQPAHQRRPGLRRRRGRRIPGLAARAWAT